VIAARPGSGVSPDRRGTYAGLVEKIPYLVDLGVTAVELLPVFQFDPQDAPTGLTNYWGYAPVSFFAPHAGYSSRRDPLGVLDEFRERTQGSGPMGRLDGPAFLATLIEWVLGEYARAFAAPAFSAGAA